MTRCLVVALATLTACPEESEAPHVTSTSTGATSIAVTTTSGNVGLDSTGEAHDRECSDLYHGNQAPGAAHPLSVGNALCTEVTDLVVCDGEPDFFVLDAPCSGYLGIELRRPELDSGIPVPDLVLYDGAGQPLEEIMGDWDRFFLKPLHRPAEAGPHVLEVRHAGGPPEHYGVRVTFLPGPACW